MIKPSTARPSSFLDRDRAILERCKGKRVLHLGCVGFTDCSLEQKIALAKQSLHQRVTDLADCMGVDSDASAIAELHSQRVFTNVRLGDVEHLEEVADSLGTFDVVLAGDIIEHLSNPGLMLEGIKRFLKPQGRLLLSTPNSMGLPAYLRYLLGRFHEGRQHVLCFNAIALAQLLDRHGYHLREVHTAHQALARNTRPFSFRLGHGLLSRFPKLGGTLFVVAGLDSR